MDSYVVRVYRQEKDNPRMLVGTIEKVGKRGRAAFTNMDELWEIVDEGAGSSGKKAKVKEEREREMLAKGRRPERANAHKRCS